MENAKKQLSSIIWCYLFLAGLSCLLLYSALTSSEYVERIVSSKYSNVNLGNISPTIALSVAYGVEILFYLINYALIKKVVDGESNGILIAILLTIGIVLSVLDLFKGFYISTFIGMIVDIYVLLLIFFVRKENKNK